MWARALIVVVAVAGVAVGAACGKGVAPVSLLPDLVQNPPSVLVVTAVREQGRTRFRLGFLSSFWNVGKGPLEIVGRRASTSEPTMRAEQVVRLSDGGTRVRRGVGSMRYVKAETHEHWHL